MKINVKNFYLAKARAMLSNEKLAKKAGVSPMTLSKIANGRTMRAITAGKIAKALGVDVAEITILE